MKIYVASSWRNNEQPGIVKALREAGHEVYDFKNPAPGNNGFHWSEIDPNWKDWTPDQYLNGLLHPVAQSGFKSDFDAMKNADMGVLVLPSGRSAHIEAGYFVGSGKPLVIMVAPGEPELMYLMANTVVSTLTDLLEAVEEQASSTAGKG